MQRSFYYSQFNHDSANAALDKRLYLTKSLKFNKYLASSETYVFDHIRLVPVI